MQDVKDDIEEQYWQAVVERDSSANGTFFVAVRSTGRNRVATPRPGVYNRPTTRRRRKSFPNPVVNGVARRLC